MKRIDFLLSSVRHQTFWFPWENEARVGVGRDPATGGKEEESREGGEGKRGENEGKKEGGRQRQILRQGLFHNVIFSHPGPLSHM